MLRLIKYDYCLINIHFHACAHATSLSAHAHRKSALFMRMVELKFYFTEMQTCSLVDIYLKFHVLFYTGISLGLELCKIEITLFAPSSN